MVKKIIKHLLCSTCFALVYNTDGKGDGKIDPIIIGEKDIFALQCTVSSSFDKDKYGTREYKTTAHRILRYDKQCKLDNSYIIPK